MPGLDFSGPFMQQLSQPAYNPPSIQPTGYEGTGAFIANIASQFLKGVSQGRARQFAEAELDRHRKLETIQNTMKMVSTSDLPDERKQQLMAGLATPMANLIAWDGTNGKKGNNKQGGAFGAIRTIFQNMTGGPPPKKADPLEMGMGAVADAINAMQSERTQKQIREGADAEAMAAINMAAGEKGGWQNARFQDVMQSPAVQDALGKVYSQNDGKLSPQVATQLQTFFPAYRPGSTEAVREEMLSAGGTPQTPQPPGTATVTSPSQPPAPPPASAPAGMPPAVNAGVPSPAPAPAGGITTPVGVVPRTTMRTRVEEEALDQRGRQRGRVVDLKTGDVVNVDYSPRFGYVYGDTDTPVSAVHAKMAWQPATASLPFATVYNANNRYRLETDKTGNLLRVRGDGNAELVNGPDGQPIRMDTARGRILLREGFVDDRFHESQGYRMANQVDSLIARRAALSLSAKRLTRKADRDAAQKDIAALDEEIAKGQQALGIYEQMYPTGGGAPRKPPAQAPQGPSRQDLQKQIQNAASVFGAIATGQMRRPAAPAAQTSAGAAWAAKPTK